MSTCTNKLINLVRSGHCVLKWIQTKNFNLILIEINRTLNNMTLFVGNLIFSTAIYYLNPPLINIRSKGSNLEEEMDDKGWDEVIIQFL